jgi:hypothetical protein
VIGAMWRSSLLRAAQALEQAFSSDVVLARPQPDSATGYNDLSAAAGRTVQLTDI